MKGIRLYEDGASLQPTYYVYMLLCRAGGESYIKFGHSMKVGSRIDSLRTACPLPVKVMAVMEIGKRRSDALAVEREIHREFASRRLRGEWFKFNTDSLADKEEFNSTCRMVFRRCLGRDDYWVKINVAALDAFRGDANRRFLKSRTGRRIKRLQDAERAFRKRHGLVA